LLLLLNAYAKRKIKVGSSFRWNDGDVG